VGNWQNHVGQNHKEDHQAAVVAIAVLALGGVTFVGDLLPEGWVIIIVPTPR
jgi:hypothetical protein